MYEEARYAYRETMRPSTDTAECYYTENMYIEPVDIVWMDLSH